MQRLPLIEYTVIASDPDAEWRTLFVEVRATSEQQARDLARAELARTKRDHFSLDLVLVAA